MPNPRNNTVIVTPRSYWDRPASPELPQLPPKNHQPSHSTRTVPGREDARAAQSGGHSSFPQVLAGPARLARGAPMAPDLHQPSRQGGRPTEPPWSEGHTHTHRDTHHDVSPVEGGQNFTPGGLICTRSAKAIRALDPASSVLGSGPRAVPTPPCPFPQLPREGGAAGLPGRPSPGPARPPPPPRG